MDGGFTVRTRVLYVYIRFFFFFFVLFSPVSLSFNILFSFLVFLSLVKQWTLSNWALLLSVSVCMRTWRRIDRDLLSGWLLMSCRCNTCHSLGFWLEETEHHAGILFPLPSSSSSSGEGRHALLEFPSSTPPSLSQPPAGSSTNSQLHSSYTMLFITIIITLMYCSFIARFLLLLFSLKDSMIIYRLVSLSGLYGDGADIFISHLRSIVPCIIIVMYILLFFIIFIFIFSLRVIVHRL